MFPKAGASFHGVIICGEAVSAADADPTNNNRVTSQFPEKMPCPPAGRRQHRARCLGCAHCLQLRAGNLVSRYAKGSYSAVWAGALGAMPLLFAA